MSSNFRYKQFVATFGNQIAVVDDVLLSQGEKVHRTTSLDENCIVFEIQTDRHYYVDLRQTYLASKLKIAEGCGYET